jgi:hypothetical protein
VTATYAGKSQLRFAPSQFLLDFPLKILVRHLAGLVQPGCTIEMLPVLVGPLRSPQATKQSHVVCADMALKLSDALGTSPELWIGMQTQYDLRRASQHHHKKVTRLFVGARHRRLSKPLPKSGGTMRARAVQGRSARNAAVARP